MGVGHDHGEIATSNEKRLMFALGLTAIFLVIEIVGGLITGSLALLSDAAHMFTDAAKAVDLELQALIADGPSSSEVVRAQQHTKADTTFFEDNIPGAAQLIGNALTSGETLEDLKAWSERIAAVTIEQVREAARAVFLSDRSVTGILLPSPEAR